MRRALLRGLILSLCFVVTPFAAGQNDLGGKAEEKKEKRFLDRGEYVEDTETGLLWQKDGTASGKLNFNQAAEYAKKLKLGKLTGWRVPTGAELAAIFPAEDLPFKNTGYNPNMCCGGGMEFRSFWTSELDGPPERDYAFVYQWYAKGGKNNCFASKNFVYVRCVREKKDAAELAAVVTSTTTETPKPSSPSTPTTTPPKVTPPAEDPTAAFDPAVKLKVQTLARDLAHDEFSKREEAFRELKKLGVEIHPLLRAEMAKAKDPEAKYRLKLLLGE